MNYPKYDEGYKAGLEGRPCESRDRMFQLGHREGMKARKNIMIDAEMDAQTKRGRA